MEVFFFLAILMWILPMFVASSIWSEKGGESWVGFAMGVVAGWVGVILAAALTPGGNSVSFNSASPGRQPLVQAVIRTKICPRCAEEVKEAALVCRFCSHEFPPLEGQSADPPPPEPEPDLYLGGEVEDVTTHAFGVKWGRTNDGQIVYRDSGAASWAIYVEDASSLVPPRGYA